MDNRATRARVSGRLRPYADGFRTVLIERGYAPSSAAGQLQLMAHLSRWLVDRGLDGPDLTPVVVEQFLRARRAAGYGRWLSVRGMAPLLEYLREIGFAPVPPPVADTPAEALLGAYRTCLVEERGLATSTVRNYLEIAKLFCPGLDCGIGAVRRDVRAGVRRTVRRRRSRAGVAVGSCIRWCRHR